jgi:DNA-binding beta-propeller fold protein YncE
MNERPMLRAAIAVAVLAAGSDVAAEPQERRFLYVAVPGVRNYVEYGGVGILVYDVANGHRLVKRIPSFEVEDGTAPENIKGIAADATTARLYLTTPVRVAAFDLLTERMVWNRTYEGGCDRPAVSPDGKLLYVPSFEGPHWHVLSAETGDVVAKVETNSGAHNTIYGLDGRIAYLAGLKSPLLGLADTRSHRLVKQVGPFGDVIRPFTVNGRQTLAFVNVNGLLGFEVGDLTTGLRLHRVEVSGYQKGPVKRHGCPSHGVALTPDERELWLTDAANGMLHIFDASVMPPKQVSSIALRDQPGWVTFGLDGQYAYPSTGEVIDARTKRVVASLSDERGRAVQSEKMLEIVFSRGRPARAGDQFGLGRKP